MCVCVGDTCSPEQLGVNLGDYLVVLVTSPQLLREASGYFLKCRWLGREKGTDVSEVVGILGVWPV